MGSTTAGIVAKIDGTTGFVTIQKTLSIIPQLARKLLRVYDNGVVTSNSDHRFLGFGVAGGTFIYQAGGLTDQVFYSATSATASTELFRIGYTGAISCAGTLASGAHTVTGNITMTGLLDINTGPTGNIGIGTIALNGNTTGLYNVGVGYQALSTNNNSSNVAIGYRAQLTATGAANVGIGDRSVSAASGTNNVGVGQLTLNQTSTGNNNTAVGGVSTNYNTTGSGNSCFGYSSGLSLITSSNNTCIGYNANVSADTWTNSTAIGYGATVGASNTIQLGNSSVTNINTSGSIMCATPIVAFNPSISGGGAIMRTMTTNCGYVLYGRMCYISYDITWTTISTSGSVTINLPFPMATSSAVGRACFTIGYSGSITLPSPATLVAFANSGANFIQLGINNYSTAAITLLQISNMSANGEVQLTGWYSY